MYEQLETLWSQMQSSTTPAQDVSALSLALNLLIGGVLALYIRFLFRRCSPSPSDSDTITRVFPLLTLVTIAVIAIVKSSLALSLGLVGSLSIVRFRASIKDPDELVYLFLCIAVGLAIGAQQTLVALVLVAGATVFVVGMHLTRSSRRSQSLLLTITGDSHRYFTDADAGVLTAVEELAGRYTLQRFDVENGRGQVRIALSRSEPRAASALIARLRERLPDCEFSYVNVNSAL